MKLSKYFLLPLAMVGIMACSTNERPLFERGQSVYFTDFSVPDKDSLTFSMAGTIGDEATVELSVSLMGKALQHEARFRAVVDEAASDAVAGTHYEALPEYYTFPTGTPTYKLPLKVFRHESLDEGFKTLTLVLTPTDELGTAFPDRLRVRVMLTNQIVKPVYWDDLLQLYFGDYSKVKHNVCISIMGRDFPPTESEAGRNPGYQMLMTYGRAACNYFIDNVVYDENGDRIYPWDAF